MMSWIILALVIIFYGGSFVYLFATNAPQTIKDRVFSILTVPGAVAFTIGVGAPSTPMWMRTLCFVMSVLAWSAIIVSFFHPNHSPGENKDDRGS